MSIQTIPATEQNPLPNPPTSGNWLRDEAGNLTPADEATARTAGLWVDDEPPAEE